MSADAISSGDESRATAAEWCIRFAEGPLQPSERQSFQAWLERYPEHADMFERTVIAWTALEGQAAEPEMIRLRGEALASFGNASRRRWPAARRGWSRILAAAACLILAIGTGLWWNLTPATLETGIGEHRLALLADGSKVSLDADTRVRFRYRSGQRELWLERGRAKFSVAKDPLRPFSVRVDGQRVVATGTQFSIEKLGRDIRIVLYEGRVAIVSASDDGGSSRSANLSDAGGKADQLLRPGTEMVMSDSGRSIEVHKLDLATSLSWERGLLEFADEPLARAVERINRHSRTQVRLAAPGDGRIPISGQFASGDTEAFVEGVTAAFPLRVARRGSNTIILESASR